VDWIVDRLPGVLIPIAGILWLARVVALIFLPDAVSRAGDAIVLWVLYPVCITWGVLSIRRARTTGTIALMPGVQKSVVQKANNPTAFTLGHLAYWFGASGVTLVFLISVIKALR
jgi:hypothetical protein